VKISGEFNITQQSPVSTRGWGDGFLKLFCD